MKGVECFVWKRWLSFFGWHSSTTMVEIRIMVVVSGGGISGMSSDGERRVRLDHDVIELSWVELRLSVVDVGVNIRKGATLCTASRKSTLPMRWGLNTPIHIHKLVCRITRVVWEKNDSIRIASLHREEIKKGIGIHLPFVVWYVPRPRDRIISWHIDTITLGLFLPIQDSTNPINININDDNNDNDNEQQKRASTTVGNRRQRTAMRMTVKWNTMIEWCPYIPQSEENNNSYRYSYIQA